MGNCQAIDAAALVIQHPSGRIERLYWPISASEVMRLNPGHYVSLIIPLAASDSASDQKHQREEETTHDQQSGGGGGGGAVRFTKVKLLRPNETLALGHAYRLVTTQEVMKVLRAKKYAKTKKLQVEALLERTSHTAVPEKQSCEAEDKENINHATNHERRRHRTASGNAAGAVMGSKSWRPSLQSISEAGS